jgi:hypothetical protein
MEVLDPFGKFATLKINHANITESSHVQLKVVSAKDTVLSCATRGTLLESDLRLAETYFDNDYCIRDTQIRRVRNVRTQFHMPES